MNEALVVKYLLINKYYYKYINIINKYIDKDNNKYIFILIKLIEELKERFPETEHTAHDLQTLLASKRFRGEDMEVCEAILEKVGANSEVSDEGLVTASVEAYLNHLVSTKSGLLSVEVSQGKKQFSELQAFWDTVNSETDSGKEQENYFVPTDLGALHDSLVSKTGLRWRLDTLNKCVGSLRAGNLVVVAARPETGKTTFLASEGSYMAAQCEKPYLHVNNEEAGNAVLLRYYQAVLGLTQEQIFRDLDTSQRLFKEATGGRVHIYDKPFATRRDIEGVCKQLNPGIIVIDQLDKVAGFDAERHDLVLKAKYQWARELAKKYGPVIAVGQAGGTAENKRYLDMNDLDSSHTAKQGEADVIIGIGMVHDEGYESVRYLSIMKNKLPGDSDTIAALRHAKIDVRIKPEIARYEDARKL